jgi:hypothetical protein
MLCGLASFDGRRTNIPLRKSLTARAARRISSADIGGAVVAGSELTAHKYSAGNRVLSFGSRTTEPRRALPPEPFRIALHEMPANPFDSPPPAHRLRRSAVLSVTGRVRPSNHGRRVGDAFADFRDRDNAQKRS